MSAPPTKPENRVVPGVLTEAGRMLEFESGLDRAIRSHLVGPPMAVAAKPAAARSTLRQAKPLLELASRLRRQGQWDRAVETLRTALRLAPDNLAILNEIGRVLLEGGRLTEAIEVLRWITRLSPEDAAAHYNLGFALERRGDIPDAVASYRRVMELSPQFPNCATRLAEALASLEQVDDAIEVLTEAAAGARGAAAPLLRAHALSLSGRHVEAETELSAAHAADPGNLEIMLRLARAWRMLGRFDQARAIFRRVLTRDALHSEALIGFINAGRFDPTDRKLLDRLAASLDRGGLVAIDRMFLHFALGKAFDDLQDYARAMRAFEAANEIRARLWPCDRARHERDVESQKTAFSAAALAHFAGLGADDARPIFIVGMPRSGTTLVEQILSSHPDVAAGGELRFWGAEGPAWGTALAKGEADLCAARLADAYRRLLCRVSPNAARVTDKMPFNYGWLGLIRIVFPAAHIIHCRRHPADTCLSIFMTDFVGRMDFASRRADLVFYYRCYQRMMAHWREVLPPGSVLDVDYEQLIADREAVTRRMIGWCGLPWNDVCLRPERNQRVIDTASAWQARQPVYADSVGRWRRYEPWLGELRELTAQVAG